MVMKFASIFFGLVGLQEHHQHGAADHLLDAFIYELSNPCTHHGVLPIEL